MPLADYRETFFVQDFVEEPDGFGAFRRSMKNGTGFQGIYQQGSSGEETRGEALRVSSEGKLLAERGVWIQEGDTVRRERDGLLLRVCSVPVLSPEKAFSAFQVMKARRTEAAL